MVEDNVKRAPDSKRDTFLSRFANKIPLLQLTSECQGTVFGGVINLANMLPYGTFKVAETEALRESVYEELKSIWPNPDDPSPTFQQLASLPLLVSFSIFMDLLPKTDK